MDPEGAMGRAEVSTGAKKRPPKLKNTDRTISITIENYKPPAPVIVDGGMILEEIDNLPPHPSSAPLDDYNPPNIFYVDGGSTGAISYDDCPHSLYAARRGSFRRSDTLDVSATGMLQMRKTRSFHSNEPPTVEDVLLARRTSNSVRNSLLYPNELTVAPLATPEHSPASDRRNCSMHRSFNDPQKQRIMSRRDAMKCHSFSENIYPADTDERRKEAIKFSSANVSLENELFRSRSNSRTREEDNVEIRVEYSPRPAQLKRQMTTAVLSPEPSAHALSRSSRTAKSFYLSPSSYDELRSVSPRRSPADARKVYSASMKHRLDKENLGLIPAGGAKKSKSFIADALPVPRAFELERNISPYGWDRGKLFPTDEITKVQRSPRLTQSIKLPETRSSYESRRSSLGFETVGDVDYDAVLRSYRQSHRTRRKSSVGTESQRKAKRATEFDESDESVRKRKKIVCIITTVFVSLVFATVFVVIVSLAHSSGTSQTQSKSQKIYPANRGLPLHYNVRQENERLMQESLNRAKFTKNFTDTASLTAQEEIP
ncbi:hypothetical protein DMENIID0001_125960 [Sergentomyia squamirostris]